MAHERFLRLGTDRAEREWRRYEGTPQRELFRQLRERFLARHARDGSWALDVGSGPGRFLPFIGGAGTRRVALDLSRAMLVVGRERASAAAAGAPIRAERVCGDALRAPFPPGTFAEVAIVGNALGFEATSGERLLASAEVLLAPGGLLVLEVAPGAGERSRYLGRLPPGAVRRLLAAPPGAVLPRLSREGFAPVPSRHRSRAFRRWSAEELLERWRSRGWSVREVLAIAPALGTDNTRLHEVAREPKAWGRLLELEERLGREPARWPNAAAVLLAVESTAVRTNDFEREVASVVP